MSESKRLACWSDESMQEPDGSFRIACCEAGEPGYWVLDAPFSTLEQAQAHAEENNAARGLTPDEALDIRVSSMAAHNAGWRASDADLLNGKRS